MVEVKRICASCKHKEIKNDGTRVCTKMELKVAQQFHCKLWEMAEGLKKVRR